jgi:hypothetical protein
MQRQDSIRHAAFLAFFLSLPVLAVPLARAEPAPVAKLYTVDELGGSVVVEITNTGTINAENRLFYNDRLSASARTVAMEEVFRGALESGGLVETTLVSGDRFFALDPDTGEAIVVTWEDSSFVLPSGSASFTRWQLPGGLQ